MVLLVGLLALGARRARVLAAEPSTLFLFFLKVGAVLFGSGYVLAAFLQETVARGWLSSAELLDAIALGQRAGPGGGSLGRAEA
ncbi:MAG TPA: chromate transporter [Meiothermus sp.]|nr:chromate transporter [Meiothermus sp.]